MRIAMSWARRQPTDWRTALAEPLEDAELARVRRHLQTGRPVASDAWLARLEARLGRRLRPLPVGRPRKEENR